MSNAAFTEINQVLTKIDPASYTTEQSSGWVSFGNHARMVFVMSVGAIAATGTLNMKVQKATNGTGTGAIDMTGKAIVQLADSADNIVVAIDVREEELGGSFSHVRVVATPATAAAIFGVLGIGFDPTHAPVPQTNWTQAIKS
jgi:hypothetical protein